MKIATIISYCTNDNQFIKHCIDAVRPFSEQVIVSYGECFYDGKPENAELLRKTFEKNQGITFVNYGYERNKTVFDLSRKQRVAGSSKVASNIEAMLFLDADEIVESDSFTLWLTKNEEKNRKFNSFWFMSYWYFRDVKYRAKTWEGAGVLIRTPEGILNCSQDFLTGDGDRGGFGKYYQPSLGDILSNDGYPMIHHYSWVRTKDQMLIKARNSAHSSWKSWESLIENEFLHPFSGTDFVHGYKYDIVEPQIILI